MNVEDSTFLRATRQLCGCVHRIEFNSDKAVNLNHDGRKLDTHTRDKQECEMARVPKGLSRTIRSPGKLRVLGTTETLGTVDTLWLIRNCGDATTCHG